MVNDRCLLVKPEVGSLIITATQINTLIQFRALDYRMESCSAIIEITGVGSSTIDVWSLALNDEIDLQGLSYRSFPRRIDKVCSFTPTYNATEQLSSFMSDSGTYRAFLLACPQGSRKEDY
jgi:hypothetical protein